MCENKMHKDKRFSIIRDPIFVLIISIIFLSSLSACAHESKHDKTDRSETVSEGYDVEKTEKGESKNTYGLSYKDIAFVSDEAKEKWRCMLIDLFENEAARGRGEDIGEMGDYELPDPDSPGILRGWQIGLFDINVDGIPELLVDMGGGSAGNAYYYVYDLRSGEKLGSLNGGHENSWCIYFNTKSGKYEAIGQFEWRIGWFGKERFIDRATITSTVDGIKDQLYTEQLFYAYYSIDVVYKDTANDEHEQGSENTRDEINTGVSFQVNGQTAYIGEYFSEYDSFVESNVRIPETGLKLIRRSDYATAEEIVGALLSTEQQFVKVKDEEQ